MRHRSYWLIVISFFSICSGKDILKTFKQLIALQQIIAPPIKPHYSFFSPNDNIKALLIGLCAAETQCIHAAVYRLTDDDVADALISAHKRGVNVELVFDGSGVHDGHSKFDKLKHAGVKVYIHPASAFRIMHLKMFIFGRNIYGRSFVWTGSANPTGGLTRNAENVIVLTDRESITRCDQEFQRLKELCKKKQS